MGGESYLNMDVTISQVRERTPIQIQGMVTVFRNWLNWWYVNAARTKKKCKRKNAKLNCLYSHTFTQTHTRTCPGRDGVLLWIQLQVKQHNCSKDHESPDCQLHQVTQPRPQLGVWAKQKAERQRDDSVVGGLWQGGGQRFAICVCCMYTVHHTIVADVVCLA